MKFCGHDFQSEALLTEALTTPAYRMSTPDASDNQRLEFLGDSVLGLIAAERLFRNNSSAPEGELTVRKAREVSTAALCAAANRIGLEQKLIRNKGAKPLAKNAKTLADAVEAIIGAAYLDGGLEAAREVVDALQLGENAEVESVCANPKGDLQILAQSMLPPRRPQYRLVKVVGKSHEPIFTVEVAVEGFDKQTASARTHKQAEVLAAEKLLELMQARRR